MLSQLTDVAVDIFHTFAHFATLQPGAVFACVTCGFLWTINLRKEFVFIPATGDYIGGTVRRVDIIPTHSHHCGAP